MTTLASIKRRRQQSGATPSEKNAVMLDMMEAGLLIVDEDGRIPWPTPDHDEVALRVQVIRDCDLEVAGLRVHLEAAVRGLGGLVVWPKDVTP